MHTQMHTCCTQAGVLRFEEREEFEQRVRSTCMDSASGGLVRDAWLAMAAGDLGEQLEVELPPVRLNLEVALLRRGHLVTTQVIQVVIQRRSRRLFR